MSAETFLDAVLTALDARGRHGASELPPIAILWPDQARQWAPIVGQVRSRRLVLELDDYDPENLHGPAYWIRGVLDKAITIPGSSDGSVPIVYLPGYARSDIRAVEDADPRLMPLAEFQYRGTTFAQQNGRDWTIAAFLQSKSGGLGIEVPDDQTTKEAMLRARVELSEQLTDDLKRRAPLRASFFDSLLAPDLDRDVLSWLNDAAMFRASLDSAKWEAFRAQFADRFGIELEEGEIVVAGKLGRQAGPWGGVWRRYAEAPDRYPTVEQRLHAAAPKRVRDSVGLFDGPLGAWPQDNEEAESRLRRAFADVATLGRSAAAERIEELEKQHSERRSWVWAELGEAPLATASAHLAVLAANTRSLLPGGSVSSQVDVYTSGAWVADDAVMRALAAPTTKQDRDSVSGVVRAIYEPWLDASARRFQEAVGPAATGYVVELMTDWPEGTCLIFVDGLRFDVGKRIEAALVATGFGATIRPRLAALPTITSTAKPAVSPVVAELGPGGALAPVPKSGGVDLTIAGLRVLLTANGYQVLQDGEAGDPQGRAWTEHGDVDELGHKQQAKLPGLLDGEVRSLCERIAGLLDSGWRDVVVVTDHGWLYLPGGLPKAELPYYLTKDERMKKGRTGRLADGAMAPGDTVPWFWDSEVRMAVAPGISAFVAGAVYEHGGVSAQECITPVITVTPKGKQGSVSLALKWRGLRADVSAAGAPEGALVDLRRQAGDPNSSLLVASASISSEGVARILVSDEDAEGTPAALVVVDPEGRVISQASITIGDAS